MNQGTLRSPFMGTAEYYDRFRAPYAPAVFEFMIATYGLDQRARVLDIGSGPGTIAIPLAAKVREVVAIDRDQDMLDEGRRLAAARGAKNIRWLHCSAEALPDGLGMFEMATFGQSFHWMDRDRILDRISTMISDGGGLALVAPGRRRPQESWEPVADEIVARFLGPRSRHPAMNKEADNEPSLRRSKWFSTLIRQEFQGRVVRDFNSILGCLYSMSGSAKPLLGARTADFEAALLEALQALQPDGIFREAIETEVVLAPKLAS